MLLVRACKVKLSDTPTECIYSNEFSPNFHSLGSGSREVRMKVSLLILIATVFLQCQGLPDTVRIPNTDTVRIPLGDFFPTQSAINTETDAEGFVTSTTPCGGTQILRVSFKICMCLCENSQFGVIVHLSNCRQRSLELLC